MFALIDCDDFYASCERVFQPKLRDRPVIVLSNNDGCVIALSEEAEELGFEMGDPFFEVREEAEAQDVAVRSSNYTLYGDMSRRVLETLEQFSPHVEEYSIDEVFMRLEVPGDATEYARRIARTVRQWTGIPVSVALAPTKTLTKVVMEFTKKAGKRVGNYADWADPDRRLETLDVGDVWGIGPAYTNSCHDNGIHTALDLRECDPAWARDELTVTGLRRKYELEGLSCIPLEENPDPKKHVTCGRMFGRKLTALKPLREAITTYALRAAERMRGEGECAGHVQVFLRTSRYEEGPGYSNRTLLGFNQPTDASHLIARKAVQALKAIYQEGYRFHKGGVILGDLVPADSVQRSLHSGEADPEDEALMDVLDEINEEYGQDALQLAGAGREKDWFMERDHLSQGYTTRWEELVEVQAGWPGAA